MPVTFKKIKDAKRPFSKFHQRKLLDLVEKISFDIILEAKAHHRFKAQTGNLERSVKNRITTKGSKITSWFTLDNRIANYGKYIHRGFKHPNPGWGPDPFLLDAILKYKKNIKKQIKKLMRKLR